MRKTPKLSEAIPSSPVSLPAPTSSMAGLLSQMDGSLSALRETRSADESRLSISKEKIDDECQHLVKLCEEATELVSRLLSSSSDRMSFVPGLVVSSNISGLEFSSAVVCVFLGESTSDEVVTRHLRALWTEDTAKSRVSQMRKSLSHLMSLGEQDWDSLEAALEGISEKRTSTDQSFATVPRGPFLSPATAPLRELRKQNAILKAELESLKEIMSRTKDHSMSFSSEDLEGSFINALTESSPLNAEMSALRRRSMNLEKRTSIERSLLAEKTKKIENMEISLNEKAAELSNRERVFDLLVETQVKRILSKRTPSLVDEHPNEPPNDTKRKSSWK